GGVRRPRGAQRSQLVIVSRVSRQPGRPARRQYLSMILPVQRRVHDAIIGAIRQHFGLADVPAFTIEVPPNRALGDLAVAVAFQLARPLRKAPRAIAQELAGAIGAIPGVANVVAAPNGYLNFCLGRAPFLRARLRGEGEAEPGVAGKSIV